MVRDTFGVVDTGDPPARSAHTLELSELVKELRHVRVHEQVYLSWIGRKRYGSWRTMRDIAVRAARLFSAEPTPQSPPSR